MLGVTGPTGPVSFCVSVEACTWYTVPTFNFCTKCAGNPGIIHDCKRVASFEYGKKSISQQYLFLQAPSNVHYKGVFTYNYVYG